jgi:hypothetical protein
MLIAVLAGVAVLAFGIAMIWYLVTRGSRDTAITRDDFETTYDELVADGQAEDRDRDTAWRDFHNWQLQTEEQRLEQEEASDESP